MQEGPRKLYPSPVSARELRGLVVGVIVLLPGLCRDDERPGVLPEIHEKAVLARFEALAADLEGHFGFQSRRQVGARTPDGRARVLADGSQMPMLGLGIWQVQRLHWKEGLIARQPVEPLARLLLGAMTEAAIACAGRSDVRKAGNEYVAALGTLLEALRLK